MIPLLATILLPTDSLVRVDVPDHPEAIATSAYGSTLLAPPSDDTPWREEPVPAVDAWVAHEAIDALGVEPWHDEGFDGNGVSIAIFDIRALPFYDWDLEAQGDPASVTELKSAARASEAVIFATPEYNWGLPAP